MELLENGLHAKLSFEIAKGSADLSGYEPVATPAGFKWWKEEEHDPIFVRYKGGCTIFAQQMPYISFMEDFLFHPEDVVVCGFMKTGTTWVQEIAYQLLSENDDPSDPKRPVLSQRAPLIEGLDGGLMLLNLAEPPRQMKTHFGYHAMPTSFHKAKPKVIYTYRNPKDTCVSFYHFMRYLKPLNYTGSFDEFFESFVAGDVISGPWWTHIKGFWENKEEMDILFVPYEDLHKDFRSEVKRIAAFLDKEVTEKKLNQIQEHCSFTSMETNNSTNYSWWDEFGLSNPDKAKFMRKGVIGDWKNYLSEEQSQEIEAIVEKELSSLGIKFCYDLPVS